MPETRQWSLTYERKLPFDSSVRINYNGNHIPNNLKYALGNLPLSPLNGPVVVANHPNNAPAAGFPDLRGKTHRSGRRGHQLRRHGPAGTRRERGLSGGGADRGQRDQPARAPHQRAAAGSALHVEPHREQRREVLVRRDSDRVDQAAWRRSADHDELHAKPFARHHVRSHIRRRGRLQPAGAERRICERLLAVPYAAPVLVQQHLHPSVHEGSARHPRLRARRLAGVGRRPAHVRHAVHGDRRPASTWTSTGLPRPGRSCWTRRFSAARSTIPPHRRNCCRSALSGRTPPAIRWTRWSAATRSSATACRRWTWACTRTST